MSSRQAASWAPGPAPSPRIWSRPPLTSTTARAGRVSTRGSSVPEPESVHLLVALDPQLLADLAGDAVELPAADGHLGQSAIASAASRKEGSRAAERTILRSTEGL